VSSLPLFRDEDSEWLPVIFSNFKTLVFTILASFRSNREVTFPPPSLWFVCFFTLPLSSLLQLKTLIAFQSARHHALHWKDYPGQKLKAIIICSIATTTSTTVNILNPSMVGLHG
jgi:hypothetical protein